MVVAKVLNIEVDDRLTKVCVSEKNKKSYKISNCFLMQTPDGAVYDGQVVAVDRMAEALRAALNQHGASGAKSVTFTLTSGKVASREVMLPPVKDNRIKSVVETNASEYFPVDMGGYRIGHTLLERLTGDVPGCRVQVTVAPRSLLESYAALAEAVGLTLDAVDYCGNSQYQVLHTLPSDEVTMYVDVSLSRTMVTFMKDGLMLLQRNINFGGSDLVSTAMESASMSDTQLVGALELVSQPDELNRHLSAEQQEDCLSRLVNGISRSADFFKSNHSGTPVTKVVMMGVCGAISGLSDMVGNALGIQTVTLNEVKGIDFVANSVGGVNSYISCIGSLVQPLELLPEELRSTAKKKKSKKGARQSDSIVGGVVAFAAMTVLGLALTIFAVVQYTSAGSEQARLQQRVQELEHVRATADIYEQYQSTQAVLDQLRGYNQTHNASLVAFLEELERKMPSDLLLMSAVCDNQGVILNIVTPGMEEANVVIKQLRGFESIKQLEISTITESTEQGGIPSTTFSVRCGYNAPDNQG